MSITNRLPESDRTIHYVSTVANSALPSTPFVRTPLTYQERQPLWKKELMSCARLGYMAFTGKEPKWGKYD